jgi:hypothetical protein
MVTEKDTMKHFEEVYTNSQDKIPLKEMAVLGYKSATPKWPGMKIEVETSEYQGTGEKPHAHLYAANHKSGHKEGLITRFELTDKHPEKPSDIKPLNGNPAIPADYVQPIFEWSQSNNKRGVNNWTNALNMWDAIQASVHPGQI